MNIISQYTIEWKGNQYTNVSSRRGHAPSIIVDHITDGTAASTISWFRSQSNTVSSAHFLVTQTGRIYQFVKIEDNAWANGMSTSELHIATASIVREKGVNPNWYTVSIEHEGIYSKTRGELTKEQLEATIWLHGYIIDYVKKKWHVDIPRDRKHILGHYQIDPVRKPQCPGEKYPFDTIIRALNHDVPNIQLSDIKGHWAEEYIKRVVEEGIIKGYPGGLFKPNQYVTRAELATVMAKLLDKEL